MKKEDKIKVYYSNPKICDICGKVIPYDGVKSLDKAYKRKYCGKECTDKSKEKENSRRNRPNDMYTGIYCIKNIINDKRYIGQSKDCVERKTQHFSILRLGKHYNKYLQSDWNTYGENNFEFTILEKCQKEKLDELEKKYIKLYDSCNRNKGYNIELGLNPQLLSVLRKNNVQIETASDAHKQSDVGANIPDLANMLL